MLLNNTGTSFPIAFDRVGENLTFEVQLETAIKFFKQYGVVAVNYAANQLGLYAFATGMRGRDAKFGFFNTPKHLLREFSNGCAWNPVKQMTSDRKTVPMFTKEFQGEQCADIGEAWEDLYGTGINRKDLLSTPQGKAFLDMMLSHIYDGLDTSFSDVIQDSGNPLISIADTNGDYNESAEHWASYMAQQLDTEMGGFTTLFESLKAQGLPNFNVEVKSSWFDPVTRAWVGDVRDYFRALKNASSLKLSTMIKSNRSKGGQGGILAVDPITFQAYKDKLVELYNGIPQGYELEIGGAKVPGLLQWDGDWVLEMNEWASLGAITNHTIIRGIYTVSGVLGVPLDVDRVPQGENIGLLVNTRTLPPYQGKTYMNAIFRVGAAILSNDHIVHGSVAYHNS